MTAFIKNLVLQAGIALVRWRVKRYIKSRMKKVAATMTPATHAQLDEHGKLHGMSKGKDES